MGKPWENFSQLRRGGRQDDGVGGPHTRSGGSRLILALRKQHVGLLPWTAGTNLGAADTSLVRVANWVD